MKRIIAMLSALVLCLSLAACSSNGETPTGNNPSDDTTAGTLPVLSPDNPHTLTVWLTTNNQQPNKDNVLDKLLKEELGITLEYSIVTPDNATQIVGTMLAGGKFPDLIGTTDQNARFITGGALIPLDKYLKPEVAPLLAEHVKPYWNNLAYDAGAVGDGNKHIYILPNYNRYYGEITGGRSYGAPSFMIQKAVLEDAGYPSLDNMTIEKFFELIENYKNKYPQIGGKDTIGFEILAVTGREWGMTNVPMHLMGWPNNGDVTVDENNKASLFATTDYSKRWFSFLNEQYNKGLVDAESFTQTLDGYLAKLGQGNVLGFFDQFWSSQSAYDALVASGDYDRTWVPVMPTFDGIEPWYLDREVMNINQGFGVSVSSTQPEVAVAFLNEMLTEKWQKRLAWGIEGQDYEVNEEGRFYRTADQRKQGEDLVYKADHQLAALNDLLPKHQGTYSDGNAYGPGDQPEEFFVSLSEYDQNFLAKYNKKTWRDFLNQPKDNPVWYPCWNITKEDGSEAQQVSQQMVDMWVKYYPRAIIAKPGEFEGVWTEYLNDFGRINTAAYLEVVDKGIADRIALLS
ncbi:hypothetical protein FACS1894217_12410 [Clostridia bacterium]|nr:hypothetical protein FACS1894217_12410 [Clostridia bacterium]